MHSNETSEAQTDGQNFFTSESKTLDIQKKGSTSKMESHQNLSD